MREYIFTPHEIQTIKQFHKDGRKTQAIITFKHRCKEQKAKLTEHLQILDNFLDDYANPTPECFGSEKVNEVDLEGLNLDCLKCAAQGRCLTAYVEAQIAVGADPEISPNSEEGGKMNFKRGTLIKCSKCGHINEVIVELKIEERYKK